MCAGGSSGDSDLIFCRAKGVLLGHHFAAGVVASAAGVVASAAGVVASAAGVVVIATEYFIE